MKQFRIFLVGIMLTALIASCSTERSVTNAWMLSSDNGGFANVQANNMSGNEKISKKIIFKANLTLAVKNTDTANIAIKKIAEKYKGYVNEIGTYQTIIRVESNQLESAIEDIKKIGKLRDKSFVGQDVTDEFLDYKIRLENAEKSRERYLELLKKAENVEATLKVEKELERLNEVIELLKGKMARIEHLANYSTITILLKEIEKPGIIGYIGIGLYYTVKWLFVRN